MQGCYLVRDVELRSGNLSLNANIIVAFGAWTVTTALYNTLGIKAAAKGKSLSRVVFCVQDLTANTATVPFVFIFYFFYDIAYTPMLIAYTLEILPFNIRAKGFAVMVRSAFSRIDILSYTGLQIESRCIVNSSVQPIREPVGT